MTNQLSEIHKARLRETLKAVEDAAQLDGWDQADWARLVAKPDDGSQHACGTAFCFAGHAANKHTKVDPSFRILWAGWAAGPENEDDFRIANATLEDAIAFFTAHYETARVTSALVSVDGEVDTIDEWAQDYLGLSTTDATRLFDGGNTLGTLQQYVANLLEFGATLESDLL